MAGPTFFATPAAFRHWLERHAATSAELVVGYHKVDSDLPSMRWPESVDEALCFGWIDGVRRHIDEASYQIRFTPRRPGSIWSAVNIAKYLKLLAEGRITAAGASAFARRTEAKSVVYSYEQADVAQLTEPELRDFRKHKAAWRFFEDSPPGHRKLMLHWIVQAKRPQTRAARLARLIEACTAGTRLR